MARRAAGETGEFDPRRILFQGSGLLVIDKPAGLAVHRGTGHEEGLLEQLSRWISGHPGFLKIRPGKPIHPIHLMDLEASGVLLLGLARTATRIAKEALAAGGLRRRCLAVVAGPLPEEGSLEGQVRTKLRSTYRRVPAALEFRRLCGDERLSLVEVVPHGG
ncbi:MAG: RNA pseudouridine synthase, partial [Planctomycetes bacterium]|nr:RNA pseudouridine synthase [Planctomycetota bacterium]